MAQDHHNSLVRAFEEAEQASQEARSESERARDYYDGRQLTPEQIKELKKRKQPIVIENLIRPKVDYLCGLERQSRTDPRALPRTIVHEDDANAATDALRYATEDQDFAIKRSHVFQNMLIEGFGGVEVTAEQVRDGIDPAIKELDWDRLFFDPHSRKPDFSDAMYLGYVTWMDFDEAIRRWPDARAAIEASFARGYSSAFETYDDKPRWANWSDGKRRRVRIVTMYDRRRGQWERCVFTLSGEVEPTAPSPFLDENGHPDCGLILQSAYVDRDNDRYGPVRDFMTLQDEVNKRRSKFLHLSNSRPVRVSPASGLDPEAARQEFNRPDGILMAEQGEVEDLTSGAMAAGHFNLLAEAKDAIKAVGPNATMQGKSEVGQSGRAILALQQGGMTEVAPLLDALRHFNIRVYRAVWNRIRQFWTAERWVRVTDDEKNVRFVGFNVSRADDAMMKIREALRTGQIDQQQAAQFSQQVQLDPVMMQPMNVVAELDVDIEIDEVVDTPTLQIEQFDQLTKLAPMAPPQFLPTMFEMMIEASSLRNKDKLREIMEQAKNQKPDPMQQAAQQLQFEGAVAEVEKTKSETKRNNADAQAKLVGAAKDAAAASMGMI
ncbi:6-phosphogluconolactonase [Caenibius sp. WL]|uniref:portal protein n=1 Tax=Caenibius sp. WL TaxID=2872646 RepID=UPI001C997C24|nr:6-phosphogluconolactonase [Caenibius sp. WL]QZP07783.1 6-phosphogluconolactonase [Caenibius sp. WL]QZP09984.1 6-phosphogluconolactonase [Caenibius sp. WL]